VLQCRRCACVFLCICMRMHMCVYIYTCAFFVCCEHVGTGVLGTRSCADVYVRRRNVVYWNPNGRSSMISCRRRIRYTDVCWTSTYTSATHSLQSVYICVCAYIYVYSHAYVHGYISASMILFEALRCRC